MEMIRNDSGQPARLHFSDRLFHMFEKQRLSIGALLGGEATVGRLANAPGFDPLMWSFKLDEGLSPKALQCFQAMCFPQDPPAFYRLLGTSVRTAQRASSKPKKSAHWSPAVSANAVMLAHLIVRSIEIFGSPGKAQQWWSTPNQSLDGKAPIEVAVRPLGGRSIEDTLTAIEHGFFS